MECHLLRLLALATIFIPCTSSYSSSPSDKDGNVCISQGGRFPRFSLEGQPPRRSLKGPDDLTLCRVFRKKTCCTASQTHPAFLAIRRLASDGEGSQECLMFWEAMECAICDPRVGVHQGPPVLCAPFCESCLKACGDAFFSFDPVKQVLMPCGPRDTICGRARKLVSNGTEFCRLAGFSVPSSKDIGSTFCFDGKMSLDARDVGSQEAEKRHSYDKVQSTQERIRNYLRRMDTGEAILWAVGGLVLTAGVLLMRRRCQSSLRKKAALVRRVQEAKSKQQAARLVTNKKIGKRG